MPFDVPPVSRSFMAPAWGAARRRDKRSTDLTLGVFRHGGAWKLYCAKEPAITYDSRRDALAAAEAWAAAAARSGRRVELFVQDEDGALRQAKVELH